MAKIRRRKKVSPPAPPGGYGKGGTAQIGDDRGFWLAAGETASTPNAQQGSLWNAQLSPAINTNVCMIMVETPRQNLLAAAAPNRSRLEIDFIDGSIDVFCGIAANADAYIAFVGVYVGEYVSATNLYDVQDSSNAAEISREWLYVEGRAFYSGGASATLTQSTMSHSPFNLTGAVDVVLEGGEALMLSIATSNVNSGNTIYFTSNIRLHFADRKSVV